MNLKNVKDRVKDETLDLSLCDLKEVPVREIATVRKATHLDLSNNLLTSLPDTFINLKHLVKLNLSQNMLTDIPENFGELRQLKHLDLYANQISRLPLSLSELKNLRWLDLKENPLTPAVASVAGTCSNLAECQACARNIVTYLTRVKLSIEEEKLRRLNTIREVDTVSSKKIGKRKKKKQTEKNSKQDLDKNVSNLLEEQSPVDDTEVNSIKLVDEKERSDKQSACKGNACRYYASMIAWLLLLYLGSSLAIVILPLYWKQSEWFINYLETSIGIPLKAFQKHNTDMLYSITRTVVNFYDNMYYA